MRIIGGKAKGRKIRVPEGCRIRPTTDRVKKSLFDILHPIEGKSFLDLFSGSCSVGLEALSRGARVAIFVERDHRLAGLGRDGLQELGFDHISEVVIADVERGLRHLMNRGTHFDVVFADPPYGEGLPVKVLQWVCDADILNEKGIAVFQHSIREELGTPELRSYTLMNQRRYGDTMLSFFIKDRGNGHEKDCGLSGLF